MKVFLTSIALIFGYVTFAQTNLSEGIILKVNDRLVTTSEFKNVYVKNANIIADEDKMSVDEYFELFIKYHLKLEAAYQNDLDESPNFQKEYQKYYKQLADSYISNGEVTEKLVKETYQRLVNEVKASHILISFKPNSTPDERKKAYDKALQIREELEQGADFETLAKKHSEDPSAKINGGNIGWFKGFKMVYPFENAVYNLKVGEISEPVETQFGFHVIKKTDQRPSIGKIRVAHIMINRQQQDTLQTPESRIKDIYKKVEAGEDFHDLAKQFSQDKNTAIKGGEMQAFEIGDINSQAFSEQAFLLTEDGQVSQPFETRFGWHIVKRLGVEPLDSFEEQKESLTKKIKTSDRSKMLNERIQAKIEEQYQVTRNDEALAYLNSIADETILKGKWQIEENVDFPEKVFLQIDEATFSWKELAMYVQKQQRAANNRNTVKSVIEELADNFVYSNLVEHHKKYLPELDAEFAETINEYKSGLLLYEVMEKEIWEPAKNDSLALQKFYQQNASKYKTVEHIEVEIASFNSKRKAKQFLKMVKSQEDFSTKAIASTEAIFQEKENVPTTSSSIANNLKLINGISKIYKHNGQYLVYNIFEVKPVRQLNLDEVRGRVISDYQDQLEKEWIESLQAEVNLVTNQSELEKLRKEFE